MSIRTPFLALIALATAVTANPVIISWNPSISPSIAYYVIHLGSQSGNYTNTVETAGTETNMVIPSTQMFQNRPNYFVVTAVDAFGLESEYSNEVIWTNFTTLNIQLAVQPGTNAPSTNGP